METVIMQGKTYHHREKIKQLGGRWNPERKNWLLPLDQQEVVEKLVLSSRGPLPEDIKRKVKQDPKWRRFAYINARNDEKAKEDDRENPYYLHTALHLCFCTDHHICIACQYGCCDQVYIGAGDQPCCKEHGNSKVHTESTDFERRQREEEHKARKWNLKMLHYVGD